MKLLFPLSLLTAIFISTDLLAVNARTYSVGAVGREHATWQLFEDAHDQDFVTNDSLITGEGYDDATPSFTAGATIDGSTTSSTQTMIFSVNADHRHNAVAGNKAQSVVIDMSSSGHIWQVNDDNIIIEYFEMTGVEGASDEAVRIGAGGNPQDGVIVRYNLIYDLSLSDCDGIYNGNWSGGTTSNPNQVIGNIIHDVLRAGVHHQLYSGSGDDQVYWIFHNTIWRCGDSGEPNSGSVTVVANQSSSSVTDSLVNNCFGANIDGSFCLQVDGTTSSVTWNGRNNLVDNSFHDSGSNVTDNLTNEYFDYEGTDNTSPGAGNWVIFNDYTASGFDFTLVDDVDNDALDLGVYMSDYATDLVGTARANPPEPGAWEVPAPAAGATPGTRPKARTRRWGYRPDSTYIARIAE